VDVEGFKVMTNTGLEVGHVDRVESGVIVVEHGVLKHRFAVPHELAHVDDDAKIVHLTVSKALLDDAPKMHHDRVDIAAVAAYYGYDETESTGQS
jgi:hypothetical protein